MTARTYSALLLAALTACAPASSSREPTTTPIKTARVEAPREPPDEDGDGIDDARDRCCCSPEDLDGFEDEDGCPDRDNDGDVR